MRIAIFTGLVFIVIFTLPFSSCIKDSNFDSPEISCSEASEEAISFAELKAMYTGETIRILENATLEAYVASSDRAGNFFGALYLQNAFERATDGLLFEIDLRDSYQFYPAGAKVRISLRGLYLGKRNETYELGGAFSVFGNTSVGRLPANAVTSHIKITCSNEISLQSMNLGIEQLKDEILGTLITLTDVEIAQQDLGASFAEPKEETIKTLLNCSGNKIGLLNSGFSTFQNQILPNGNGSISGVLVKRNSSYQLIIRDLNDISFLEERCLSSFSEQSSDQVFISEIADPVNKPEARFIELYNAAKEAVNLNGWRLLRYTNDNLEAGGTVDLSAFVLQGESTLTISSNASEFEKTYGFMPDLEVTANGPADSNGDDNLVLLDPFAKIVDVFGVVGEDGSGTNHEFEDGKASRNAEVLKANSSYTFNEWTIYNDTGGSGTINMAQVAPADFSPGTR